MTSEREWVLTEEIIALRYRLRETEKALEAARVMAAELGAQMREFRSELAAIKAQGSLFGGSKIPPPFSGGTFR